MRCCEDRQDVDGNNDMDDYDNYEKVLIKAVEDFGNTDSLKMRVFIKILMIMGIKQFVISHQMITRLSFCCCRPNAMLNDINIKVRENGHSNQSSNPGWGCRHFTLW